MRPDRSPLPLVPCLALLVVVVFCMGCVRAPRTEPARGPRGENAMRLDERADGTEVRLSVGEMLEIVLAETPTTGYRWDVVDGGAPACSITRDAFEPGALAPGAPGHHTWWITAAQAGTGTVSLVYRQPFGGGEPARRFTLRMVVE